jgi:hypothetical protein
MGKLPESELLACAKATKITFTFEGKDKQRYDAHLEKLLPDHDLAILLVEDTAVHDRRCDRFMTLLQ